ncbi:MAG: hypothetical protein K2X82_02980 [Gemmataceae bacterium]|nr:hypothetical protein [Gemmataceae bacterium]
MRIAFLVLVVGAAGAAGWGAATFAAGDESRKFGPEWTKVGNWYYRAAVVEVSHSPGGNVSGYRVPLENGEVRIHETDDDDGLTLVIPGNGEFHVQKAGGKAARFTVWLKGCRYYDLDADGMVDVVYDNRGGRGVESILLDGRLVRVRGRPRAAYWVRPDGAIRAEGFDAGVKYVFERGAWREAGPK